MNKKVLISSLIFLILLLFLTFLCLLNNDHEDLFNKNHKKQTETSYVASQTKSTATTEKNTTEVIKTNKEGEYIFDVSYEHSQILFKFEKAEISEEMRNQYKDYVASVNPYKNIIFYDNRTNKDNKLEFEFSIGFVNFKFNKKEQNYNTELQYNVKLKHKKTAKQFSLKKDDKILIILSDSSCEIKNITKEGIEKYIII